MRFGQLVMLFLLLHTIGCVRGPQQLTYTPDAFRTAVLKRLGPEWNRMKPISISNNSGIRQLITPSTLLRAPFEFSPGQSVLFRPCIKWGIPQRERFNYLYNCLLNSSPRFKYSAGTTLNAASCFREHIGNCFSMTNLLIGISRYAKLDANYVLVEDIIGNREAGKVVIHTNHIVTAIRIGTERRLIDFLPGKKRYHYLTLLSDVEAAGLYYNNLGSALFLQNRQAAARELLGIALKLYPDSYQIQNNFGVLLLREGDIAGAKHYFLKALQTARFPDLVMGNVLKIFEKTGNMAEFKRIRKKLEKAKKRNPYFYLDLADREFNRKGYHTALKYCRIAKRINPMVPEIYRLEFRIYSALNMEKKKAKAYKKLLKYIHYDEVLPPVEKRKSLGEGKSE